MTTAAPPQAGRRADPLGALERLLRGDPAHADRRAWALALVATTLLAGLLRLVALRPVALNPFYDAAVRSMGLSWHNFFFGAFDPSARAAIDKPPVDLWLQVLSVKLLGFKPVALKLPAALAATLSVPLLYDAVRRFSGNAAGLLAAVALAVLPVSVLTARSDTMDSLMMALLVLAAWLVVRASERHRVRYVLLAGVALGLAFNTKLLEALIAAPALGALTLGLGWGSWRARGGRLAAAAAVFVITALSWITIVSLAPRHDRPYPIGSTNGSVWNAVFVFNGTDRLFKAARPDTFGVPNGAIELAATPSVGHLAASAAVPVAPRRRRTSKSPPGPVRLFARTSLDYGGLIGVMLLAAIAFGGLALLVTRPVLVQRDAGRRLRVTRAGAAIGAVALWLLTGYLLFSFTGRLHQRYLEAFTPAVAAALGAGLAALGLRARDARALLALLAATLLTVLEVVLVVGTGSILHAGEYAAVLLALVVAAAAGAALALRRRSGDWPWWWLPGLVTAGAVAAVLVFPLARDVRLIRDHSSDEAAQPLFKPSVSARLSAFLRAHQGSARYEFAAAAPTIAAPILTRDVRPILLLTSNQARPLVTLSQLQASVAAGEVRYVVTRGRCPVPRNRTLPACSPLIEWVKAHGVDLTARLATSERQVLYAVGAAARAPVA